MPGGTAAFAVSRADPVPGQPRPARCQLSVFGIGVLLLGRPARVYTLAGQSLT